MPRTASAVFLPARSWTCSNFSSVPDVVRIFWINSNTESSFEAGVLTGRGTTISGPGVLSEPLGSWAGKSPLGGAGVSRFARSTRGGSADDSVVGDLSITNQIAPLPRAVATADKVKNRLECKSDKSVAVSRPESAGFRSRVIPPTLSDYASTNQQNSSVSLTS